MRETGRNGYANKLVKHLKTMYPDSTILRNDPNHIQGIPDITIINGDSWAALEVKKNATASHQPNQDYYVNKFNEGATVTRAWFIFPENEEEVLNELQSTFESDRQARLS